jgi:hypothetical protein
LSHRQQTPGFNETLLSRRGKNRNKSADVVGGDNDHKN